MLQKEIVLARHIFLHVEDVDESSDDRINDNSEELRQTDHVTDDNLVVKMLKQVFTK